jgi:hypothetical protein
MTRFTVDTNVPIVANGIRNPNSQANNPSLDCRLAAVEFLQDLLRNGCVVLDLAGEIQAEYRGYLSPRGQPGVGDRFYLEVLNSAPGRIERVDLPRNANGEFEDFPDTAELSAFDLSDRKFAALARRERIPVANATDSDWLNHHAALEANGISVRLLCGSDRRGWFA